MVNIRKNLSKHEGGYTLAELLIAFAIISIFAGTLMSLYYIFFSSTLHNNYQARLAVESQSILRSIVEELRVSSGIAATSKPDTYVIGGAPTWSTSNANLVLIINTPATDINNNVLFDVNNGMPYVNQIVYFANQGKLYKRYLADNSAIGNRYSTSCPATNASTSCPADVLLSSHFKNMTFRFFDQDDIELPQTETDIPNARSIELNIDMEHTVFGETITYNNNIRMTMRND